MSIMTQSKISRLAAAIAALIALQAHARDTAPAPVLGTVVTTATREERASFELPVSVDIVTAEQIQSQRIGVNVSETLNRVPGTVVHFKAGWKGICQVHETMRNVYMLA